MTSLPKTCFLIDDDPDDQEIFGLALQNVDIPIVCSVANDADEAIARLSEPGSLLPDYIFLDMNMPRINGAECLREIRKLEHLRHIPVIMYSTSLKPNDIELTRNLGATDFITKPSNIGALTTELNNFFRYHKVSPER
jgi:CheY-like chemotaxis protein